MLLGKNCGLDESGLSFQLLSFTKSCGLGTDLSGNHVFSGSSPFNCVITCAMFPSSFKINSLVHLFYSNVWLFLVHVLPTIFSSFGIWAINRSKAPFTSLTSDDGSYVMYAYRQLQSGHVVLGSVSSFSLIWSCPSTMVFLQHIIWPVFDVHHKPTRKSSLATISSFDTPI